jgi:hypothetical protein
MLDSAPRGVVGQLLLQEKVKPSRCQPEALAGEEDDTAAFCAQPLDGPAQAV